ncbi:MAG TPA: YtxH domain-containing protein [Flavihumibacter sp.]|nr:YtxH domain-containing protein [Bacteroidota bacterium]HQD10754.1 YtxH domain-containing protein [Flavihumibacter sp.]
MSNTNKILTAFATGLAVGAVLGVLFAPDKGENTRKKIADNGKKLSDSLREKVNEGKEKFAELRGNLQQKADAVKDKLGQYAG